MFSITWTVWSKTYGLGVNTQGKYTNIWEHTSIHLGLLVRGSNHTTVKKSSTYHSLDTNTTEEIRRREDEERRWGRENGELTSILQCFIPLPILHFSSTPCGLVIRSCGEHVKRCNSNGWRHSRFPRQYGFLTRRGVRVKVVSAASNDRNPLSFQIRYVRCKRWYSLAY